MYSISTLIEKELESDADGDFAQVLNSRFQTYKESLKDTQMVEPNEMLIDEHDGKQEEKQDEKSKKKNNLYDSMLRAVLKVIYRLKQHGGKVIIFLVLVLINLFIIISINKSPNSTINVTSFNDISKSLNNLQFQINELNSKNKHRISDFKNYLDLKIEDFNKRFSRIEKRVDDLSTRLASVDLNQAPVDSSKVPFVLDSDNNVRILPEFESFLNKYIQNQLQGLDLQPKYEVDYDTLIEKHADKLSHLGFMKRDEILALVSTQFNKNKSKLVEEIKSSEATNHKFIDSAYTDQINYATFTHGARIINWLTSPTFSIRQKSTLASSLLSFFQSKPVSLQGDIEMQSNNPYFTLMPTQDLWRSAVTKGTTLAIKFDEPIYMNKFDYVHQRITNAAYVTSTPKKLSVFVDVVNKNAIPSITVFPNVKDLQGDSPIQGQYEKPETLHGFVKLGTIDYDIDGPVKQSLRVSKDWSRVLVRSVLIRVDENYGNELYTSLGKFDIGGLTRLDLKEGQKRKVSWGLRDDV